MIEHYLEEHSGKKAITYASVPFGAKVLTELQLKKSIQSSKFLALYLALDTFAYSIKGRKKPVPVLIDKKIDFII